MKRLKQTGFTLIELMIVLVIIGILAAIALPAYQDSTKRAYVAEGLSLAAEPKAAVVEFWTAKGNFPKNNDSAGLPVYTQIKGGPVTKILVANGKVTVTFNDRVQSNGTIALSPTSAANGIQWSCTGGTINNRYRPPNCRQ